MPGLRAHAGRHDHHIGARDVGVSIGALEFGVIAFDRARPAAISSALALRQAFDDVEQNDVAEFLERDEMGQRAADLSAADERDFPAGHGAILSVKNADVRSARDLTCASRTKSSPWPPRGRS